MTKVLRFLFFLIFVRPFLMIVIGMNVRRRELLPAKGPAVLVANHNSHLDAFVLMTLFPISKLPRLRPVAAADYFLKNRFLAWFSLKIIGIIPITRTVKSVHKDPLAGIEEAMKRGDIIIFFPEGSRGEPELFGEMKRGIAHVAKRFPEVPFTPIFLHGLGKALPRGEALLVPFFCDVFIGESLTWTGDKDDFMEQLKARMQVLSEEGHFEAWE